MPDKHGCFTTNEIHYINDCKKRILKEYDSGVRKYGTDIARNGLRKALDEVLRQEHREAVGRHFWEGK